MGIKTIIAILVLWNFIGFLIVEKIAEKLECEGVECLNPFIIYEEIPVNYFGCICLTILFNIFCPLLSIGYWVYKLCTIGRT